MAVLESLQRCECGRPMFPATAQPEGATDPPVAMVWKCIQCDSIRWVMPDEVDGILRWAREYVRVYGDKP